MSELLSEQSPGVHLSNLKRMGVFIDDLHPRRLHLDESLPNQNMLQQSIGLTANESTQFVQWRHQEKTTYN
jgi:hypothetical protein